MNGKERNISLFRKLSAYIMQDNQLHANLTVEEAMNVAANLKLSQKVLRGEKMDVVSKLRQYFYYFTITNPCATYCASLNFQIEVALN
jgi:ABC-type multidrug transport system ATPase subunit